MTVTWHLEGFATNKKKYPLIKAGQPESCGARASLSLSGAQYPPQTSPLAGKHLRTSRAHFSPPPPTCAATIDCIAEYMASVRADTKQQTTCERILVYPTTVYPTSQRIP